MKKKLCLFLFALLALNAVLLLPFARKNVKAFSTSAKAMCVLEKESGRIICAKNENEKLPMASTTKIVTAITVIENCKDLKQVITVDDKAIGVEGTSIYLKKGEQISVEDLLYGLMLRSGNDSATALAIHVAGSIEDFALMMNDTAKKVGATNSNFANPHGLDDPNHYTTAYDLAKITAYALKNPIFKNLVSTKRHVIEKTNVCEEKRYLKNKNKLLNSLDGCCGVKTGFTSRAGRCLVSACERGNECYVCVVLNCGPMFEESSDLLNQSFEIVDYKKIIDKSKEIVGEYSADNENGKLFLYTDQDFYYPLKPGESEKLKLTYNVRLDNAKQGDEVGEIQIFLDKHLIKTVKLFTMNKIDKLIDSNTLQISEVLWEETNEN